MRRGLLVTPDHAVKVRAALGQRVDVRAREPPPGEHAVGALRLVREPLHVHGPVDDLAGASERRESPRRLDDGDDAEIDAAGEAER